MTWKLTEWAKGRVPLRRVPWRDLTDEEFEAANAEHDGLLAERGYFEREPAPATEEDKPEKDEPDAGRGRNKR